MAKVRVRVIKNFGLDLENELLQCEFTNELRTYREDIQIVCNHIAVENQTRFLSCRSNIQFALGLVSERFSCAVAHTTDVLFALGIADAVSDC